MLPTPTAHTPSGADLGGPVIVPVTLVTVPLSNNGAKTAAHRGRVRLHYHRYRASPLLPLRCVWVLIFIGYFICMATTIQKVDNNWLNRYLYS